MGEMGVDQSRLCSLYVRHHRCDGVQGPSFGAGLYIEQCCDISSVATTTV